ncbi:hypothetical protein Tco_1034975, partial [Tanacetum coccineum]
NIKSKDSYVSNLDDSALLVTPLSDANEEECFDPEGVINEIDAFLDMDIFTDIENGYHDSEGDIIYLESLLIDDISPNLPPEVYLNHDPRSLKDEPDNDVLMTDDKVFDPGIHEKSFSLTFVKYKGLKTKQKRGGHHLTPLTGGLAVVDQWSGGTRFLEGYVHQFPKSGIFQLGNQLFLNEIDQRQIMKDPMIREYSRAEIKTKGSVFEDLEASISAYK